MLGPTRSKHGQIADKIVGDYVRRVTAEGEYQPYASGGRMVGDIQQISLTFQSFAKLDISQVREILVQKEEEFLAILNANREVRPYLHQYPAGIDAFDLDLVFMRSQGGFVDPPYIAYASVTLGKIGYDIHNQEKGRLDTVFEEPYGEAYKIVYGKERD